MRRTDLDAVCSAVTAPVRQLSAGLRYKVRDLSCAITRVGAEKSPKTAEKCRFGAIM